MEKLNQLMVNEPDRKTLNNLIKKKEKETKFKDRYKPSILDVQNILRYKPSLYSNSFLFEKKSNSVILKNNSFINNEKTIDYNKEKKYIDKNNNNTIEVNENKEEKNYINGEELKAENKEKKDDENSNEKKDELSEDEQIKLKYKISDIYNLRNEKVITNKSAEKYLFKNTENKNNNNDNNFYTTSKSKSDWIPNRTIGSKMNSFSSVSYNILSPLSLAFSTISFIFQSGSKYLKLLIMFFVFSIFFTFFFGLLNIISFTILKTSSLNKKFSSVFNLSDGKKFSNFVE